MRLIKSDKSEFTGITTEYWLRTDNKITIRRYQDVQPFINKNVAELNSKSSKSGVGIAEGVGKKVASIPFATAEQIKTETGLDLMTCRVSELEKFLNNSDYAKLRTAHGRL